MLKILLDDPCCEEPIEILQNDRGQWEIRPTSPELACYNLVGFDGENILTLHIMEMQDRTADIVVVHACVDNPARVKQARVVTEGDYETLSFEVNKLIAQVCDYPEEL